MDQIPISETTKKVGEKVRVAGWVNVRRDHGKLIFIDLRDRSGLLQIVFGDNFAEHAQAEKLRPEWVIAIEGTIAERPANMVNNDLETGTVELRAEKLEILNEAKTPPFDVLGDGYDIGEEIRLKHRYLDLRRPRLQKNLRLRHEVTSFIRSFLKESDFVEIETPLLTKSTPEGARDFVVPSRLQPGMFYALPQSPQQYKQLLMVAGFERYFQIARAIRDEDTRGDRQPEHTQIDMEMAFVSQDNVLALVEEMIQALVKKLLPKKKITETPFPRLTYKEAIQKHKSDRPDLRKNKDELAFAFMVDFPMFEKKENGSLGAVHHPFTRIKNQESGIKETDPLNLVAEQYDLVLNGEEVGGGSIREHNSDRLQEVFEVLGHSREAIGAQFGHLLEAFKYGVPPHGGIAIGLDRLVMVFAGEPNIREVIAFPKTGDGRDLMMGAPAEISKEQLKELGIEIKKKK